MTAADRLAALSSAEELRGLPIRYASAYARLDLDELVMLYAPDVELARGQRGRLALREQFERGMRTVDGAGLHTVILHTGNHIIQFTDADSAAGQVYCFGDVQRRDGSWYRQTIVYTDTYTRADGTWYFARQRRHELVYGITPPERPNHVPPAHWPASQVGRGTLPDRWPSWQRFWNEQD
jgi:hypothetical protein